MANMSRVNKALIAAYPQYDIIAVRGDGYVYFDGKDGFDQVDSIYANPVSTTTEDLTRLVLEEVRYWVDAANSEASS